MSSVVIVAHPGHSDSGRLVDVARTWLDEHGHDAWVDTGAVPVGPGGGGGRHRSSAVRRAVNADLVLSLGGDGTMLRAVHLLEGAPVPVLGINLGSLGYLTELEPPDMLDGLRRYFDGAQAGQWELDERLMLDVTLQRATALADAAGGGTGEHDGVSSWRVLNECVVDKEVSGHTVRLLARIDGEPFTSYAADGLIVATPTGSTAYSLSARGPVVSPRHRALLLTPVAPHMLFDRSLVLDPSETVDIEVLGDRRAVLAVDGRRVATLDEHDVVSCVPSAATARFVRFSELRYHQILKVKFGLEDR